MLRVTTLKATECTRPFGHRESAAPRCETISTVTVIALIDTNHRSAAQWTLPDVTPLARSMTPRNRQYPRACCTRANPHGCRSRHRPKRPDIRQCFADPGDSQTMEKWYVQQTEDRRVQRFHLTIWLACISATSRRSEWGVVGVVRWVTKPAWLRRQLAAS